MADLIQLPALRETQALAQALAVYDPDVAEECDGARTLRLVERAVESMQDLRVRADLISAQALDLIQLTHRERTQMQADLRQARAERATWETQAQDAQRDLADATLKIREITLARREAELAARHAHTQAQEAQSRAQEAQSRAQEAEARARSLEFYLKKIGGFLQSRLVSAAG
jgi:chromosome segregation ATPase